MKDCRPIGIIGRQLRDNQPNHCGDDDDDDDDDGDGYNFDFFDDVDDKIKVDLEGSSA